MSAATDIIQARIDALNDAIGSGARSVTLDGQTVVYNTTASLIQARDDMLNQLAAQQAAEAGPRALRPRQTYGLYTGRGYN